MNAVITSTFGSVSFASRTSAQSTGPGLVGVAEVARVGAFKLVGEEKTTCCGVVLVVGVVVRHHFV